MTNLLKSTMHSDHPQHDVPSLDEDLVAYLDGELDDQASRRLEERLANDESARQRLRALATSWNLLDHLPRTALDDSFTRTTVELIASQARQAIAAEEAALPVRRRRRWIAAVVAGLAAAMIGFTAVVVAWPDPNERLLRDLPVVKSLELYDFTPHSAGIDFLRRLEKEELFVGDVADDETGRADHAPAGGAATTPEEMAARRAEVEAMSAEKRNELRKLYDRFQLKPASDRQRLRALDQALRSDPDEAGLRAVLESYHNWLATLSPLDRGELLEMPADEAILKIRQLKQEELRRLAQFGRSRQGPLTLKDVEMIDRWLQERIWKKKDEILAKATRADREWFDYLPEDSQKRSLVFMARPVQPGRSSAPKLDKEEWRDVLDQLPTVKTLFASQGKGKQADESLKQFPEPVRSAIKEEVSRAATDEDKQRLLFEWLRHARFAVGGGVSREELMRFFREELSEEDQKKLSSLSPDRFHRELRHRYFVEKELPPGREFGRRGFRGGRGEGGRGPGDDGRRGFDQGPRRGPPPPGSERGRGERHDENSRRDGRPEGERPHPSNGDNER